MKTITLTDEQYQALQRGESITIEPPKQKWEPPKYAIFTDAEHREINIVKRAIQYRREFAPDYVVPPLGENVWCIGFDSSGRAAVDRYRYFRPMGTVYMPQDIAEQLAADINSGRVEL